MIRSIRQSPFLRLSAPATMLALLMMSLPAARVRAAGMLVADGGLGGQLEIKEHTVNVTINNGIAITQVTEVFQNMESRQVEALYTFPVPNNASVANFSMWIDGKEMVGEVLEKEKAREIYNSYKKVKRDPGLLEQVDYFSRLRPSAGIQPPWHLRRAVLASSHLSLDALFRFTSVLGCPDVCRVGGDW